MNYSSPRLHATINDWPSGQQRVTATFAVESHPKRGERVTRTTTGTPKALTYAVKARIVDGDDGRTYLAMLTSFGHVSIMQGNMKFEQEVIHKNDPRYPTVHALFEETTDHAS
jgi:hypothetical protein